MIECNGNPPSQDTGWKNGPPPKDTWGWGGVVPTSFTEEGFLFANFCGDFVLTYPGEKRLTPPEIKYYNNSIGYPFKPGPSN